MAETTIPDVPAPVTALSADDLARMSPAERKRYLARIGKKRLAQPEAVPAATGDLPAQSVLTGQGSAGLLTGGTY